MHRFSSDNKYPEFPQYTHENLEILKKIVVEKTKLKFEDYIKQELYDRAGMNHSSVRREGVFSNANDIAKFISIVKREGEYSGEYVIESKSASVIELFAHYHSSTLNGGIVWSDKSRELTLIFLNNGDESQLNPQNAVKTGDMLRHCLIDIFRIDN
jgi:CubicO group peptidase (beta-lactamase class C family)